MLQPRLRIGEVARRSGVSIDTIRYYEKRKLLPVSSRSEGGFRLFAIDTVGRVQFIRQAQDMGLSLDEIRNLLTTGGATQCHRVRDLLRRKLSDLNGRMTKLRQFKRTLSRHLAACERELETRGANASCPVITKMSGPEAKRER